jgi:hypothetical protein
MNINIKKEGLFVSRHSILANLKSNTMKTDAKLVLFEFSSKFLLKKIALSMQKDE